MKLTAGILLVYTQDDFFFGRINNAKGKHPTAGQFSFLARKRQS